MEAAFDSDTDDELRPNTCCQQSRQAKLLRAMPLYKHTRVLERRQGYVEGAAPPIRIASATAA
eukprot:2950301-Pleurochrysis_carterae.AAC.9